MMRRIGGLVLACLVSCGAMADEPSRRRGEDGPGWTEERVDRELRTAVAGSEEEIRRALDALASAPSARLYGPLSHALKGPDPYPRMIAAQVLGRIRTPQAVAPLVEAALSDPVEAVRRQAVKGLFHLQGPEAAWPFIDALSSATILKRIYAAQALGALGNPYAIAILVTRLTYVWGASNRGFAYIGQQVTYIKDFDIEIAANAAIANPTEGVVSTGIVQDAKVLKVTRELELVERRVVAGALRDLTGADFGENGSAWAAWWKTNRDEVLAKYAAARAGEARAAEAGEAFVAAYRSELAGETGAALNGYYRVATEYSDTRFGALAKQRLSALKTIPDLDARLAREKEESDCRGLLGKGRSFLDNGDRVRAAAALRELLRRYPESDFVPEATRLLKRCDGESAGDGR